MREGETAFLYELARNSEELKLLEYLTEADEPIIRYRAAELLGGLTTGTSPDVQERIHRTLQRTARGDDHDEVRAAAIDALYLRDEEFLEELIDEVAAGGLDDPPEWMGVDRPTEWLDADYAEFRLVAAAALGRIGDRTATSALVDAFTDPDVRVRARAVRACGAIGDPRCIDALASRLDDGHDQVRRAAARALASIGTEEAIAALAPAARSDTEEVRVIAVGELGAAGSLEPLPLLVEALDDRSELVRRTATRSVLELLASAPSDRSHAVREDVAERVVDAAPPDIVSQLLSILNGNQPGPIRRNATWLLGQLVRSDLECPDGAQAYLVEALDDPDEITAKFAMSALVDLDDSGVVTRLRRFVRSDEPSETAVSRAEFVLGKKRDPGPSREAVSNSVEFTYVSDPSDYTAKKRDRAADSAADTTERPERPDE